LVEEYAMELEGYDSMQVRPSRVFVSVLNHVTGLGRVVGREVLKALAIVFHGHSAT